MTKPYHQVVDLRRAEIPAGDEETRTAMEERIAAAQHAQRVPYAVAPGQRLELADGRVLEAGAEVTVAMLEGVRDERGEPIPGWQRLRDLVWRSVVLERDAGGGAS